MCGSQSLKSIHDKPRQQYYETGINGLLFLIIVLQNVISIGAGEELVSQYRSVIFYHSGKPEWVETIKVSYTLCVLESCLKANTEEFERIIYGQGRFLSHNLSRDKRGVLIATPNLPGKQLEISGRFFADMLLKMK